MQLWLRMPALAAQSCEAESQLSWLGQPAPVEPSPVYILMYFPPEEEDGAGETLL